MNIQTYKDKSKYDLDTVLNVVVLAALVLLFLIAAFRVGATLPKENPARHLELTQIVQLDARTPEQVIEDEKQREMQRIQLALKDSDLNSRLERLYSKLRYPHDVALVMEEAARAHNIDSQLLLSICVVESRLKTDVVSYADAVGICQIVPKWHNTTAEEMKDYKKNIDKSAEHIATLFSMCKNNKSCAIQSYNAGIYGYRNGVRVQKYENLVMREYNRTAPM